MSTGKPTTHRICFVLFDGFQSLDLTGPYEVFNGTNRVLDRMHKNSFRYDLSTVAIEAGPVRTESGLQVLADRALRSTRESETLIVVGGTGVFHGVEHKPLIAHIKRIAAKSQRLMSVCNGSLLLAAAGLLNGKTACTHWSVMEEFCTRFPSVVVDRESLYRRDGNVWTSAGVTAGIDLALAVVEHDHGAEVAQIVARWLVLFLRRPGGQSQFAAPTWHGQGERDGIKAAQDAIAKHPEHDHRLVTLAADAAMSERNFLRVFTSEVGVTPTKFVETVRVNAACELLERTSLNVEAIATRVGFGTSETLRRTFLRTKGVTPTDYRARFTLTAS